MEDIRILYERLLGDNRQLKEMVRQRDEEIGRLKEEISHFQDEIEQLSRMGTTEITFDAFMKFLKVPFDARRMPKAGGIYAYYHPKEELIYVGQSVNMYARLRQHFRRGKITVNGHDSEFSDIGQWRFYVLEYIDRDDKEKLDQREAYWIALAKVATSSKQIDRKDDLDRMKDVIMSGSGDSIADIETADVVAGRGSVTNRTRGNNVRM